MEHPHLYRVMRIKSQWNSSEFEKSYEYNDGTTQTEQDMNYSIREIVTMASQGIGPAFGKEPEYMFPPGAGIPEDAFDMSIKESEFDEFDAFDMVNRPPSEQGPYVEEREEPEPEAKPTAPDENKE